jgi:hypothetical protein
MFVVQTTSALPLLAPVRLIMTVIHQAIVAAMDIATPYHRATPTRIALKECSVMRTLSARAKLRATPASNAVLLNIVTKLDGAPLNWAATQQMNVP